MENYQPFSPEVWQGRVDDSRDPEAFRLHQVIRGVDLTRPGPVQEDKKHNFCFLGFCSDLGIQRNRGREGAARAPDFIRRQLANLPRLFTERVALYDAGDIVARGDSLQNMQEALTTAVSRILSLGWFPLVLGGGHEVAWGHYLGIDRFWKPKRLGIINLDAHFDLRPYERSGPSSGTMFLQIADYCRMQNREFHYLCLGIQEHANTLRLFKKAVELGVQYLPAKEMVKKNRQDLMRLTNTFIDRVDRVYLTLCSDVFSSAFAPGVSASQPLGLHPEMVLDLVKAVAGSGKLISFDIAEISPRFDSDNQTAKLGALVIFALINTLIGSEKLSG